MKTAIVITGPTGCGKSEVALELFQDAFGLEDDATLGFMAEIFYSGSYETIYWCSIEKDTPLVRAFILLCRECNYKLVHMAVDPTKVDS
jgi:serine kinase of HPr protein (carbohydrate metabolism regulator)